MHKPSFCKEGNQQLKAQYAHKLWDQYYVSMIFSTLQSSPEEESFTKFWGCLVTMFGGHMRQSRSSATPSSIDTEVNEISDLEGKLSKNSRQHQTKSTGRRHRLQTYRIRNKQLTSLLDSKALVNASSQAVTTNLTLSTQPINKGSADSNGTGFVSKPYLRKPRPSQLAPGADGSSNPDLECQHHKDTGLLKDNCIKLNHWLAMEQKNIAPKMSTPKSKPEN